ncbi:MAG TPA: hypothetical protein VLU41_15085, partial [Ideonella sp.]|nr:hypothetical protein [Ideonella sp.]
MASIPPATADRPAPWPDTSRPGELTSSSAFGSALPSGTASEPVREPPPSAFDVCHVGVVLRAVVLVQGAVALGTMHAAADLAGWMLVFARGSVVSLWAVLLWLALSCAAKRRLARLPVAAQWLTAIALGAACTAASGSLLAASALADAAAPVGVAALASGAAIAAALF